MSWILVGMVDITAMAIFVKFWFPDLPQWIPALVSLMVLYGINLCGVRLFGELEFWLTLVKVIAILGMMLASIFLLATGIGLTGAHATLANIWNDGGCFPPGLTDFWSSLPIAFFAFGGSELVGLAAGEARTARTLSAARRQWRDRAHSDFLYRLADRDDGADSLAADRADRKPLCAGVHPDRLARHRQHHQSGLDFRGAVVLQQRTVRRRPNFAARWRSRGMRPAFWRPMDGRGVPVRGISASAAVMFIGVILNYFVPGKVLEYIISSSAVLLMGTWTSIIISHIGFRARTRMSAHRKFPMPLYPWASWIVLAFIAGIAVIMATYLQMYIPIAFVAGLLRCCWCVIYCRSRCKGPRTDDHDVPESPASFGHWTRQIRSGLFARGSRLPQGRHLSGRQFAGRVAGRDRAAPGRGHAAGMGRGPDPELERLMTGWVRRAGWATRSRA